MTRKRSKSKSTPRGKKSVRAVRRVATARGASNHRPVFKIRPRQPLDPLVAQVMKVYEEAIRHFNKQSYRRAKDLFEKVVAGPSRELAERARVHLAICEQRSQRAPSVHLRSADDHYHYAVSQINVANFEDALAHLEKARKLAPKADYIYYALASVSSLTGEFDDAISYLAQAIKLRPENRYHARNDVDFKPLEDDVRFQLLVHPDRPPESRLGELHA